MRLICTGGAGQDRLQMLVTYPLIDGGSEDTLEVRAYDSKGTRIPEREVLVLGACDAPHRQMPEVSARYLCLSIPAPRAARSLAVWVRAGRGRQYEGMWNLRDFELDDLRARWRDAQGETWLAEPVPAPTMPAIPERCLSVVLVDDGDAADVERWRRVLGEGAWRASEVVVSQRLDADANVASVLNDAVARTTCDVVALLSARDLRRDERALENLASYAAIDEVGVAAGRCLFRDGAKARGALAVRDLNWMIPRHLSLEDDAVAHEATAVAGGPVALRRSVWEFVGGVTEGVSARCWSVDLSLKVRRAGLKVLEIPGAAVQADLTACDMGVQGETERLLGVGDDAWLKVRWPEVLAAADRFFGNPRAHGDEAADELAPGVHVQVSQLIRDGADDIVRGEVVRVGRADALDGALALAACDRNVPKDDDEHPNGILITDAWTCMGDRTDAIDDARSRRVVGFSVRVPATVADLELRASFADADDAGSVRLGAAVLESLRDAWRQLTTPPDLDPAYDAWFRDRHRATGLALDVQRTLSRQAALQPVFSIVVSEVARNTEEVRRTVASIRAQTYQYYEIVDSADVASGDFVARVEAGCVLEPDALFWLAREVWRRPDVDLIFTDEDCLADGCYTSPVFKPGWDSEWLRHENYLGHLVAVRRDRRSHQARHVPRVLYHATTPQPPVPSEPDSAQRTVPNRRSLVSVVIPNKDMPSVLERCVGSLLSVTSWPSLEVVIVENNSEREETFALYERLQREDERVRVVTCDLPNGFNFSRLINYGFEQARGDHLLALNNDTEVLEADWIDRLMETCDREGVGCVGARLLYPDDTVQHAGVFVGSHLGPWHASMDVPASDAGYLGVNAVPHRMRAVTGACLLTTRDVWASVGGMDEGLPVDYNDVDFCLKVGALGRAVVVRPDVTLRHYESVSRGFGRAGDAAVGFVHAEGVLRARWGSLIFGEDPYFNPNFRHNSGRYVLDA